MEKMNFCQSCGMPMKNPEDFGTEANGCKSKDYCCYCYQNGKFEQDVTMDEMIQHCAQFLGEFNKDAATNFSIDEAVAMMKAEFPKLKRWSSK